MPVCRVAHLIYSRKIGGSEMVAANVCAHLDRTLFDPLVLFMNASTGSMPEVLARLGVACHGFEISRWSKIVRPFIVARILNRLKVDILHVHHVPLYRQVACPVRFTQVKGVVLTEHAKLSISRSPSLQQWCRRAARHAARISVVSEDLKHYFVSELNISPAAIKVIRNGVDTKRFRPGTSRDALRSFLPASFQGKVLISVGRLAEAKDQITLLRAIKKLRDNNRAIFLAVVGEGEMRPLLEASIRELQLERHVCLLGNRTDVETLLPCADVFVLSSRREGLPMVLLEAMSCGLPIVATRVGGIPEVVDDSINGFLVPPENPSLLAEALEQSLSLPDWLGRVGAVNREKIEREFSMVETARIYQKLYVDIINTPKGDSVAREAR